MIKTCRRCGQTYNPAEAFFRQHRYVPTAVGTVKHWHSICIGCELTARTEKKYRNRPKEKARRTLHSHADKYIRAKRWEKDPRFPEVHTRDEFEQKLGWNLDHMAHDLEYASGNGCHYCRRPFSEMEHGWADITLDIINPDLPPYYRTNTRWICMTCNREKQKTPPDLWGAKLQCWGQWREWRERVQQSRWAGCPLFEAMGVE